MGALHEGHGSLVTLARRHADLVVASVFVNPTQFGPAEDLARYPRDLETDAAKLAAWGADALFAPDVDTVYPLGLEGVRIEPAPGLVARLCGRSRSGHFAGVLTVVLKLFNLVRPDVAVFGQKDYQQFRVIAAMVEDLCLPIEVLRAPIVRSPDGLALSSRNAYLSSQERESALALNRTLAAVLGRYREGERDPVALGRVGMARWNEIAGGQAGLEYLEVLDGKTLQTVDKLDGEGVAAIAARVGPARLIDNVALAADSPDLFLFDLAAHQTGDPGLKATSRASLEVRAAAALDPSTGRR